MACRLATLINPRLYQQDQLARSCVRYMQTQPRISLVQGHPTANKEFWSKNKELNRPMSPHLSIYKPQLTSTLSIMNRITGLGASVVLYAGGIGAIFYNQSFPELLQLIQTSIPHSFIVLTKTALGGAIIYHTLNGIRHLVWDVGYGFNLKHLYMSGYVVVALTAVGAALIVYQG